VSKVEAESGDCVKWNGAPLSLDRALPRQAAMMAANESVKSCL
jgi:hypothetical protein